MTPILLVAMTAALAQPATHRFEQRTFRTPAGETMRYGLAVPQDYEPSRPRPLVLALHPGGGGSPFYGDGFMRSIFLPGLRSLAPIVIAPDVPARTWVDSRSAQAVLALVDAALDEFAVDRQRVLVVGFSLGGAGTWHLSARHPRRFTGAIVIAGRTEESLENLAIVPTYVIHSRDDEVVPFAQAEERALALGKMGRPVRLDALSGVGHYNMGAYVDALERGGRWMREQWAR